jgi:hypothetical protein
MTADDRFCDIARSLMDFRFRWKSSVQGPPHALKRTQRPFFGTRGLSCTYRQEQALRRGSVGTDSLLKLPS